MFEVKVDLNLGFFLGWNGKMCFSGQSSYRRKCSSVVTSSITKYSRAADAYKSYKRKEVVDKISGSFFNSCQYASVVLN